MKSAQCCVRIDVKREPGSISQDKSPFAIFIHSRFKISLLLDNRFDSFGRTVLLLYERENEKSFQPAYAFFLKFGKLEIRLHWLCNICRYWQLPEENFISRNTRDYVKFALQIDTMRVILVYTI